MADILAAGSPEYAAVELVRASLEAGSTDNVTCVVADVHDAAELADDDGRRGPGRGRRGRAPARSAAAAAGSSAGTAPATPASSTRSRRPARRSAPRSTRSTPTPRPCATRPARRAATRGPSGSSPWPSSSASAGSRVAALWSWSQHQYYVGEQDGSVVIFRGVNASIGGFDLSEPYQTTDVELDRLSDFDAGKVEDGIDATDLDDAQRTVQNLAGQPGARRPTATTADGPVVQDQSSRNRRPRSWGSCTAAGGARSCSCSSSRSPSASGRTPRSASASRARCPADILGVRRLAGRPGDRRPHRDPPGRAVRRPGAAARRRRAQRSRPRRHPPHRPGPRGGSTGRTTSPSSS